MKFTGKYHKVTGKDKKPKGGQIFFCMELSAKLPFNHKEELILDYDEKTKELVIRALNG